jgi:hypothetical protein
MTRYIEMFALFMACSLVATASNLKAETGTTTTVSHTASATVIEKQDNPGVVVDISYGQLSGTTQYEIGGNIEIGGYKYDVHFPVSRLEFPLDVPIASASIGFFPEHNRTVTTLEVTTNLSGDAGKMKDSDFGVFEGSSEDALDIYSESDADLDLLFIDLKIKTKEKPQDTIYPVFALGFFYKQFEFTCSNVDPWSPSHPEYEHIIIEGEGLKYEIDYYSPYVQLGLGISPMKKLHLSALCGLYFVYYTDKDNHLLIDKVNKGSGTGWGYSVEAAGRFDITDVVFVSLDLSYLDLEAEGEMDASFAGEKSIYNHTIDEEIDLEESKWMVSVGFLF